MKSNPQINLRNVRFWLEADIFLASENRPLLAKSGRL